jgi:hypothetical protein
MQGFDFLTTGVATTAIITAIKVAEKLFAKSAFLRRPPREDEHDLLRRVIQIERKLRETEEENFYAEVELRLRYLEREAIGNGWNINRHRSLGGEGRGKSGD